MHRPPHASDRYEQRLAELERILKFDFDRDAREIAKVEYIRITQPQPASEVA